jgi:hypothetical protein
MSPDKLAAHYAYAGWDFLALTDHQHVSRLAEPERLPDLTVIPGAELNTAPRSTEAGTSYHIVGLQMEGDVSLPEGLSGPAGAQWLIDAIREQGAVAIVAHPYWSGLTLRDLEGVHDFLALEVFNADTELHIGRGNSQVVWDDLLSRGHAPLAVASDDCHRPGQDSLRAWTVVKAPGRSPEAILGALRAGHFYASCGPEILDVRWEPGGDRDGEPEGGTVTVRCSPARAVTLVADATRGGRLNAGPFGMALRARRLRGQGPNPEGVVEGQLLTGAVFTLTGLERFARIQVEDERGRCAWSNPLFVRPPDGAGRVP